MDFSIIDRAGVTQGQFASLVGVSRVTVNTWVNGRFHPRGHARDTVIRLVKLLHEAHEAGTLPVQVVDKRQATEAALKDISAKLNNGRG